MPKKGPNSPARKKSKQGKKKTQLSIAGDGDKFVKRITVSKEALLMDKDILLDEGIYGENVPEEMVGKLFHYQITGYDGRSKRFTAQYRNRMIDKDGASWEHQDGDRETMESLVLELVERGETLYNVKFSDVRTNELALAPPL